MAKDLKIQLDWAIGLRNPNAQKAYSQLHDSRAAWRNLYKETHDGTAPSAQAELNYFSPLTGELLQGRSIDQLMQDVALNAVEQMIEIIENEASSAPPERILALIESAKKFIQTAEPENHKAFMEAMKEDAYAATLDAFEYYNEARIRSVWSDAAPATVQ